MNVKTKIVVSSVSVFSMLAATACGTGGGNSSSGGQSKPWSIQIESWTSTLPKKDGAFQQQIEKKTNTKFEVSWVPYSNYTDRLNAELASGNLPDIFAIDMQNGELFSPQLVQAINAGQVKNLTKYIEAPDFAKQYPHLAALSKKVWSMDKFNGQIYALPAYINPIAGVGTVIIRKDLWQKAGLSIPTNLTQLSQDLITIHKKFGVYGLETPNGNISSDNSYKSLEVAFTGVQDWGVEKNGDFEYQSFMPDFDNFLLWMRNLYKAGAIDPEFTLNQDGSSFQNGESAAKVLNWWSWEQAKKTNKSPFSQEVLAKDPSAKAYGLLPLKGPKGYTVTVNPFSWPIMISSKVPDSEVPKILKFMDYTASEQYYNSTQLGVKGVDYTIKNGKPVVNATKMKQTADNVWATLFENFPLSQNYLLQQAKQRGVSDADIQQMKAENQAAVADMNKMDLSEPTWEVSSSAYNQDWNNLTDELDDNEAKVIMGQMSISQWDSYVKSITSSADYKKITSQFKTAYAKLKN